MIKLGLMNVLIWLLVRDYFHHVHFIQMIKTPTLLKSTPEGAQREFALSPPRGGG